MSTEEILRQIAENEYPRAGAFDDALLCRGGTRTDFSDNFAREVALQYLKGSLDFDIADCAINALSAWAPLENFSECSWAIYRAFDEGEYLHKGHEAGTSEDLFTRPMLRKAMSDFSQMNQANGQERTVDIPPCFRIL